MERPIRHHTWLVAPRWISSRLEFVHQMEFQYATMNNYMLGEVLGARIEFDALPRIDEARKQESRSMRTQVRAAPQALLILMLLASAGSAQQLDVDRLVSMCDGKFGLCRYIDGRSKEEVIPARFERAAPFREGVAAVRVNGRYGYIDQRGELVIAPRFDRAGDFHQGLAEVIVDDNAGVIDRKGEIVVPTMFLRAIPFTSDVILAAEGTWRPSRVGPPEDLKGLTDRPYVPANLGLYHVAGHWLLRPSLREVQPFSLSGRGLIVAAERGKGN